MPSAKSTAPKKSRPRPAPRKFTVRGKAYSVVIPKTPPIQRLTDKQIVAQMNAAARRLRGVPAETLVRAFREGDLQEPCEVMRVLSLGFLLPEDHPLYVALDGE